jgi:hypothetical protein
VGIIYTSSVEIGLTKLPKYGGWGEQLAPWFQGYYGPVGGDLVE